MLLPPVTETGALISTVIEIDAVAPAESVATIVST